MSKSMNAMNAIQIERHPDILNSTLNRNSRYVSGGTTEVSEQRLEWWERNDLSNIDPSNDQLFAVDRKFNGNLRLISALFYGSDIYWWVIGQYNSILDPYSEVVEGVVLRIPSKQTLDTIMQGRIGGVPSKREVPPSKVTPII